MSTPKIFSYYRNDADRRAFLVVAVCDPTNKQAYTATGEGWVALLEWGKDFDKGERDHNVNYVPLTDFRKHVEKGALKLFIPQYNAHALPNR